VGRSLNPARIMVDLNRCFARSAVDITLRRGGGEEGVKANGDRSTFECLKGIDSAIYCGDRSGEKEGYAFAVGTTTTERFSA